MSDLSVKGHRVLQELLRAAQAGLRCPTNDDLSDRLGGLQWKNSPAQLARAGHCRLEIYAKNWRVVEIGGHRTAPPPSGSGVPYKVIERGSPTQQYRKIAP